MFGGMLQCRSRKIGALLWEIKLITCVKDVDGISCDSIINRFVQLIDVGGSMSFDAVPSLVVAVCPLFSCIFYSTFTATSIV
jgi:hypothetical protein